MEHLLRNLHAAAVPHIPLRRYPFVVPDQANIASRRERLRFLHWSILQRAAEGLKFLIIREVHDELA